MTGNRGKLFLLTIFQIVIFINAREEEIGGKWNFAGHFSGNEEIQPISHPQNYYAINYGESNHGQNSRLAGLNKGTNLVLLTLVLIGAVKTILAFVILAFLVKFFVVMLKTAIFKSILLILLLTPVLSYLNDTYPAHPEDELPDEKPENVTTPANVVNGLYRSRNRQFDSEDILSVFVKNVKTFAKSEQCPERLICLLGSINNDSPLGNFFSRILKILHRTSPPINRMKMSSIENAFRKGRETSNCHEDDYKCRNPEILLRQSLSQAKLF